MVLPAYWWLLALVVVVQGGFLLAMTILRRRGKGVQPWALPVTVALGLSVTAGLAYAVVQRDPLFFVGQGCLLILYYRMHRERQTRAK